jgi:hypothetical protein
MQIETISIPLDPQTARAYSAARADEKMKMQALVSLWLRELTAGELSSLEQVLDETGRKAQARGLTPEILDRFSKARNCAVSLIPTSLSVHCCCRGRNRAWWWTECVEREPFCSPLRFWPSCWSSLGENRARPANPVAIVRGYSVWKM